MGQHLNLLAVQIIMHLVGCVTGCIVMEEPESSTCQFWALGLEQMHQVAENLEVVVGVDGWARRDLMVLHHALIVEEDYLHNLLLDSAGFRLDGC